MKTIFLYIILLLGCVTTHAQSAQQVEQEINAHLKHIQYWRFEYSPEDTVFKAQVNQQDSIAAANTMLLNYLLKVCNRNADVLKYDFKLPENSDMKIVTSDDKKMKIFSWDTHIDEDGEAHQYQNVYQYETVKGVKAKSSLVFTITASDEPHGMLFSKIEDVTNSKGSKYYLAIQSKILVDNIALKGIVAFTITSDDIKSVDIFVDKSAVPNLFYKYNYSSNYDFRKMKEEYDIKLEKGKLYIPEVEGYKMTGKYRVYNFDGEKFVLDKNAK